MIAEVLVFSLLVIAILYFYYMDFRHRLSRLTARRDLVRATEELGLKRKDSAEPGALGTFDELAKEWCWSMGMMRLSGEQISASPWRGGAHKCHSVTGRQLKAFLPDLIALAQMRDSLPELLEER